jgi:hypothetical protein
MTNEWEKLYRAAIFETDGSKLEERIEAAEIRDVYATRRIVGHPRWHA